MPRGQLQITANPTPLCDINFVYSYKSEAAQQALHLCNDTSGHLAVAETLGQRRPLVAGKSRKVSLCEIYILLHYVR